MDKKKDGLRYSAMIKKGGFDIITFIKNAFEEKSFFIIFKLLIVTLWLGWSIPFGFILKKFKFFKNFGFNEMKKWGKRCLKIAKVDYEVIFEEELKDNETYVFASNHSSPFDIPILSATIPIVSAYVANNEFSSFFVTDYWVKSLGGVLVDKKSRTGLVKAYKEIYETLKNENSLIIFPESVMSPDGFVKPFQRGGLSAATKVGAKIVPVYIYNAKQITKPGDMHINKNVKITVNFLKPIDPTLLSEQENEDIDKIVYERLKKCEEKYILQN